MVKKSYIPDRGDVVWITLDPQKGHEQKGRRPALVLTPRNYNQKSGLALVCPITSQTKGYPFEVALPDGGAVLADHVRSVDWSARKAEKKERIDTGALLEVQARITVLIE